MTIISECVYRVLDRERNGFAEDPSTGISEERKRKLNQANKIYPRANITIKDLEEN
jgi:hypothetical protein